MNGDVKSPEEGVLTAASVRPATDVLPVVRIRATRSWFDLELRALGAYWELLYFLVWRDIKVRYRQTFIGAGWAMLQPLVTMLIAASAVAMMVILYGGLVYFKHMECAFADVV